jgi:hypothetical protein
VSEKKTLVLGILESVSASALSGVTLQMSRLKLLSSANRL